MEQGQLGLVSDADLKKHAKACLALGRAYVGMVRAMGMAAKNAADDAAGLEMTHSPEAFDRIADDVEDALIEAGR